MTQLQEDREGETSEQVEVALYLPTCSLQKNLYIYIYMYMYGNKRKEKESKMKRM